ncbi:BREX-3 system P-loop-containing protein BrxF [Gracilibacillus xinjiangensis]|uniref:BREX-3 system P-loop-containing protein BrxF n=1 Tax=Gracilibacillus xinjiangensis TaxID=1193282 RepID=A0ABV8WUW3_9BACI
MQAVYKELDYIHMRRHQLMLLVTNNFKKDINFFSDILDVPYVNINFELSEMLKDLPLKRRPRKVNELLKKIVREKNADTLVLDHIEILFDSQLQQNPILLLEDISRNFTLIVGWKGQYYNRKLVYGEPEHDEYFTHDNTEGIIIEMK